VQKGEKKMTTPFKEKAVYAVLEDHNRRWVEICDTRVPHVNGVGDPVARVVNDTLAGLIVTALNAAISTTSDDVHNRPHPDTLRLNHLIENDHCLVSATLLDDSGGTGTIEEIHFVFENLSGEVSPEAVRTAIDADIERTANWTRG
jgi:hypothetical protein